MTKAQCGSLGGKATVAKHGKKYMAELAWKGAIAMHTKYKLVKLGTSDFAIVNRETGRATGKTIKGRTLK
jgi:hypothetical protein